MTEIFECRQLEKRFHHRGGFITALSNVSATFSEGQWTAVRGYSGSGKSTFLQLLTGLDSPTNGSVSFLGHSYQELGTNGLCRLRRKWIGIVLQEIALVSHLTAQENIELPGLLTGVDLKELRKRSSELLDSVRMGDRHDHLPCELSGGERQRVAIARALMVDEPKALVADEPTSSVDSRSAEEIGNLFSQLARKGICVITASHDDRLIKKADRVLHMDDGRLIEGIPTV